MTQRKPVQPEILYCKDGSYLTSFALVNLKWLQFFDFFQEKDDLVGLDTGKFGPGLHVEQLACYLYTWDVG
jgi:hypothetical protein